MEKVDLGKGYWNPQRKLALTKHFPRYREVAVFFIGLPYSYKKYRKHKLKQTHLERSLNFMVNGN